MRTLKLLVGSAWLLGLAFAMTAQAADDPQSPSEAVAPAAAEAAMPAEPALADGDATDAAAAAELPAPAPDEVAAAAAPEPMDAAAEESPTAPAPTETMPEAAPVAPAAPVLGEIAYDSEGRAGRIHVVVRGDTLWDISDAYLGTPWVWPSIWTDNREIANPHRIDPGDHIWITDSEMRVLSPEEAATMLAASPPAEEAPAAQSDFSELEAPAAPMESLPAPVEQRHQKVAVREWLGLVSPEELDAAAAIVRRVPEPKLLAQEDLVFIGLGEGEVQVGDQFDVVRKQEKVKDPETGRFLGYHVAPMGWIEVTEVHAESSLAEIRQSVEDIWEGDSLMPRQPVSLDIAVLPAPEEVEGMIAFFPRKRVVIGPLDFVYLNRGSLDGLEAGSPLEVVRGGEFVDEPVRGGRVEVPRRVVAQLLVVNAQPETSVALVAKTETDLLVGDTFRGAQQ